MSEFRIFISSTFRDLNHERRLLQDVFPTSGPSAGAGPRPGGGPAPGYLRGGTASGSHHGGLPRGGRPLPGDLAEAQLPGPLGDRYGWEPAPDRIEVGEFDQLVAHLSLALARPSRACTRRTRTARRSGSRAVRDSTVARWTRRSWSVLRTAVRSAGWSADDPRSWKYLHLPPTRRSCAARWGRRRRPPRATFS